MKCIPRLCRQLINRRAWMPAAAALLVITLAACGTSGDDSGTPAATSVSPLTAQRGETVKITGSKFGSTARSVLIGGTAAVINSWTDTEITITVSEGTGNGPQEVTLQKETAVETIPGFFVGAEFRGTAAQLPAFISSVKPGTAVLLGARAYTLGSAGLTLDQVSLYGRGQGSTSITTAAESAGLHLRAGHGETLVLADLTVNGDTLLISNSLPAGAFAAQTAGEAAEGEAEAGGQAGSDFIAALQELRQRNTGDGASAPDSEAVPVQLGRLDALHARVLLRDVTLAEGSGGQFSTAQPAEGTIMLFAGDISFERVTASLAKSAVSLFSSGGISFQDSRVQAGALEVFSLDSQVTVNASTLASAGGSPSLLGEAGLLLLNGREVTVTAGSALTGSGNVELFAVALDALTGPAAGTLRINASSLTAGQGQIILLTGGAALDLTDARFTAGRSIIVDVLDGDALISESTFSLGAEGSDQTELFIVLNGNLAMEGNRLTASGGMLNYFGIDAFGSECSFSGNSLEVLQGASGSSDAEALVWLSCSGAGPEGRVSAVMTDNTIDLAQAAGSSLDLGVTEGSLTASGNVIGGAGVILFSSAADDEISFSGNTVTATGSEHGIGVTAAGTVSLTGNTVTGGQDGATALYVLAWSQLALEATGNSFTDFTHALYFEDESGAAEAELAAVVTDNDFLFEITAAPQVAWLENLAAGTLIDASNNRWGQHTDATLLNDFVWQNETAATILLTPLSAR